MTTLITGGTGFFSKSLLRYFAEKSSIASSSIVVLSRNPDQFPAVYPEFKNHQSITFIEGDIQQRDSLPWSHSYTQVLHAATESTIGPSLTPLQRYDQIVEGTRNILDLALATSARRFLITSSGANNSQARCWAKHGLETVVARCFAFLGPDLPLNVHFAIGNFICDALKADPITAVGTSPSWITEVPARPTVIA